MSAVYPRREGTTVIRKSLLDAVLRIYRMAGRVRPGWAFGFEIAENLQGVAVEPQRITVLATDGERAEAFASALSEYNLVDSGVAELLHERQAVIGGTRYPVRMKGRRIHGDILGVRTEVYGGLQIKVGEWDWGDPLEFEPTTVNVVGDRIPVVPLEFNRELYKALGWNDMVDRIDAARASKHHVMDLLVNLGGEKGISKS